MGLLKSLNEPYLSECESQGEPSSANWLEQVVETLIKEKSQLLSEVELGKVDQAVLEMEMVKIMDQLKLMGNRSFHLKKLKDYMFGYGILQSYLENEAISDLIITRYDYICVKENGETRRLPISFDSEASFERYLKLIVTRNGGMLNENDTHARVSDGALKLRINAVIPPRSSTGPFLAIRKHRRTSFSLEELKQKGFLSDLAYDVMHEMALSHDRVLICGKGGAGKTTLLRAMIKEIGERQRLMICESDVEIFPESSSMIGQRVNEGSKYGHQINLNDLVKDGLTMTMDGYCIGEITGSEAWSLIKAGYTDHRVLATIHSRGAQDAIDRLLMLSDISQLGIEEKTARRMIGEAIDFIVYVKGFKLESVWKMKAESHECIYQSNEDSSCIRAC